MKGLITIATGVSILLLCSVCFAVPGDVNEDNRVDLAEAIYALRSVAGLLPPAVVESAGQTWLDRNLGASRVAESSTDSSAYGDLYQWGRLADGHELRDSAVITTNSSTDVPGHGNFIAEQETPGDWREPQNPNLWQGVSGTNNPCPAGFRLPTSTELDTERDSWSSHNAAGAFASALKLPSPGYRYYTTGALLNPGNNGWYWSSTITGANSYVLSFTSDSAGLFSRERAFGGSVRCIQD